MDLTFKHLHCSSRFDRSPESLEADLDVWMANHDLITLTEVDRDQRAQKLQEQGWGHWNASNGVTGADNCAIAWRQSEFHVKWRGVKKLSTSQFIWEKRQVLSPVYIHACAAILKHIPSGNTVLVMVAHMPSGVDSKSPGFSTVGYGWATRKKVYGESIDAWSTWTKHLVRKKKPDAVMVIADWNVSLKDEWFRSYLKDHWGPSYIQAWKHFPTSGGSLSGGPVAPNVAPGKSNKDRIIDGTMYMGLKVVEEPVLMARVRSSDHRPYREVFRFKTAGERNDDDESSGDKAYGEAWWGFGDYMTDELYDLDRVTGGAGGDVL